MKSTTELVWVSKQQQPCLQETLTHCFISEGIYSFERLGESVINNPFITIDFCFLTEGMNDVTPCSFKMVTYCHLLAILVLNLQVGYHYILT